MWIAAGSRGSSPRAPRYESPAAGAASDRSRLTASLQRRAVESRRVADDQAVRHALEQPELAVVHHRTRNDLPHRPDRVREVLLGGAHDEHPVLSNGEVEE